MTPHDNRSRSAGRAALLALGLLCAGAAGAAEIVGRVTVHATGLFTQGEAPDVPGGISVSITPLAGQPLPVQAARSHRVTIHNKTFTPVFMTVQRGDRLQFINQDGVFHKLLSLSTVQPFTLDMDKVKDDKQPVASDFYTLAQSGPWHVFCRIHSKMYFRVDVVETPYYAMIQDGGEFHFSGLAPGRWQLRVAAIGSEPLIMVAEAITAPPPLQIILPVNGGRSKSAGQISTDGKAEDSM